MQTSPAPILRAIIYTRVSSDKTGAARSVDEQEAECRRTCAAHGWTNVVALQPENDRSASRYARKERTVYAQLKSLLQPGDVLVTWEASRAQRDLEAYVELRKLCVERGALWAYCGTVYDLTKGDDRFKTGLDALLAEHEVEKSRERILRAMRANVEAGRPHGRIPFGYRGVRDEATGKIVARVPDDREAAIIREAADRVLAGEPLYAILADLNERGEPIVKSGNPAKPWHGSRLRKILLNPVYAGYRTSGGQIIGEGTWEPLWSLEQHNALCAILKDPARKSHRGVEPAHLLTGIARCGVCDEPVRAKRMKDRNRNRRTEREFLYYICPASHVGRLAERVDEYVVELLLTLMEDEERTARLLAPHDELAAPGGPTIAELTARLDELACDAAKPGGISARMLGRIEAQIEAQIEELRQRERSRHVSPLVRELVGMDARATWKRYELPQRREAIRSAVTVTINPVKNRWGKVGGGVSVEPLRPS